MFILRGVPGTGKSTIVHHLMSKLSTKYTCSADDYFSRNGSYDYDRTKISDAHAYSKEKGTLLAFPQLPYKDIWSFCCIVIICFQLRCSVRKAAVW